MRKKIYITGRACRLPGAPNVGALADVIFQNCDTVTEVPRDRWLHQYFLHPVPGIKGKTYTFAAGVVDDLWAFDPSVFGISPREAGQMDPQQRMVLQVAWEALEDAGIPPDSLAGKHVGVYVGCSAMAYASRLSQDAAITDAYLMTGNTLALVSNRISHALDLRGPSMTVDTACSSSLFALKLAEDALLKGVIDTAIVAGVNAILDPIPYVGFSAARMLSPTGRCKPFSTSADGYVRSEGAVALVLQRATRKALTTRKPYAALVAVETNTDGRTLNVALPSVEGQSDLLRRIYTRSGIDPNALAFVEAHGTGTLAGDPVEATALGRTLGQNRTNPLLIGSIKSNIGHLEPASGMAGLLKALLALEHGCFPASLHAETLNPAIPFEDLNLAVAQTNTPLAPQKGPRYAGVNSFGFGGANAHAILEEIVDDPDAAPRRRQAARSDPILLLSAFGSASLQGSMQAYQNLIETDPSALPDLCAQTARFRGRFPHRAAVVCDSPDKTLAALDRANRGLSDPRVMLAQTDLRDAPTTFVFSGNGSQYAGMGLAALACDPVYAQGLRRIDRAFAPLAGWSILEKMQSQDLNAALEDAAIAQPLLFADQMALVWALAHRGLTPAAVVGHSGGEVAAACAAGVLPLDQAVHLIHERSRALGRLHGEGTMAALQAAPEAVAQSIADFGGGIEIAAINSPNSVTLVGKLQRLEAFLRHVRRENRWPSVRLAINYPYHSSAVETVLPGLRAALANLSPHHATIPFISSVTGQACDGPDLGADYWCANVRQPVSYLTAIETLKNIGQRVFIEIGATPILGNYTQACLGQDVETSVISSFEKQDKADLNPVLRTLARALANGAKVDAAKLWQAPMPLRGDLPGYVWTNTDVRIDRSPGVLNRYGDAEESHPFLGREEGIDAGVWLSELDQHLYPELCDHKVGGKVIAPGTLLAEMALAAASKSLGTGQVELRDADLLAPVVLNRKSLTEVRTRLTVDQAVVKIGCRPRGTDGPIKTHFSARFYPALTQITAAIAPDCAVRDGDRNGQQLYLAARRLGLDYGRNFALVQRFRILGEGEAEVFLRESGPIGDAFSRTLIDVMGTDAVFHGLIAALEHTEISQNGLGFVPVRFGRFSVLKPWSKIASARVLVTRMGKRSVLASFEMFDIAGVCIAVAQDVRFQAARLVREVSLTHHAFRQINCPIDAIAGTSPAISAETITTAADQASAADDSYYLLEAAAQSLAAEVMVSIADKDGVIHGLAGSKNAYFNGLLGICLRTDTVEVTPVGWRLTNRSKQGDPSALLALLRTKHPDLSAELALLTHLRATLPELLAQDTDLPACDVHFGRDAVANLKDGSVFEQRTLATVSQAVLALAANWPKDKILRIAELSDGAAQLLPSLVRHLPERSAKLFEVVVPTLDEPAAATALPLDRVTRLDLEALPAAGSFDIVISAGLYNRLATPDLVLANLAAALASTGQIIACEPAPSDFSDIVQGLDPNWFTDISAADGSVSRLFGGGDLRELALRSGLQDVQVITLPDECGGASVMLACPPAQVLHAAQPGDPALKSSVSALLTNKVSADSTISRVAGLRIMQVAGDQPRTLAYFEPDRDAADPVTRMAARIMAMKVLLSECQAKHSRLLCLVPGGTGQRTTDVDPGQIGLWAFLRTASNEYTALSMVAYDIAATLPPETVASRIAALEAGATDETELLLDESGNAAIRVMHGVGNFQHRDPVPVEDMRTVLEAPISGGLDDVRWQRAARTAPGPGELEIAVAATGLNYRDVMWSMGLLPEEALENGFAGPTIGIECSGVVIRTGLGTTRFKKGDKVLTFGPGCFASHLVVREDMAALLPATMALEAATTVPVAFFTAHYALLTLANLRAKEWVLIHGGAGGVGLAAIQIAQNIGANVIATAGSAVKRSLLRSMNVAAVLDSRSLDFAETVKQLTGGTGVDVVLNSLAGVAMERSLNCLAPFGRFLELGKQDFYVNTGVGIRPLKENITYHGIDVDQLMAARPQQAAEVYQEMMAAFQAGAYRPLPYRIFDGHSIVSAFRLMQKSGHIGKILVRPLARDAAAVSGARAKKHRADASGAHLIVGGLGGLGLEIGEWLVDAGARSIVLMGRKTTPTPEALARIAQWQDCGADVEIIGCDVADKTALRKALDAIRAKRRIVGVIHSAMVLDDRLITAVTTDLLNRTLPAKIAGAVNLDHLTRGDRLDHFVLFSSMATLIGNHGQSTYVAANGFMEGIARRRRQDGLPALAVGWGPISDVGYLARDKDKAALVQRMSGNIEFSGLHVTRALERLLALGDAADPVVHVSPMSWNSVSTALRTLATPAFGLLKVLGRKSEAETGDEDLRNLLIGLPLEKAESRLSAYLVGRIAHILQISEKAINESKAVSELGIDSLMGIELGLTLQESLGDDIPVTSVSDSYSIREISRRIVLHLHGGSGSLGTDMETEALLHQHSAANQNAPERRAEAAE